MEISKSILIVSFLLTLQWSCKPEMVSDLFVRSVSEPVINLNGTWKINTSPKEKFWLTNSQDSSWKDIQVPGEVMMQGFSIKNDFPFAYKKEINIPSDYADKNILLQFNGVYSYARVWVNGEFIRDHHGGFTIWTCDITNYVKPGNKAEITVEVTDRADEISYASGYAKHQIGGILRDVNLLALPRNYPKDIVIETNLDDSYRHSNLLVSGNLKKIENDQMVRIALFDDLGNEIKLKTNSILLEGRTNTFRLNNLIQDPKKWDAEHPNLYELQIDYFENNDLQWSTKRKIGFREIEVKDNSLLVNGKRVKLRGACRHDNHPTLGRVATSDYELKDVLLAKEANMNYIRTSHYPPSDNFLKLCDEYGLYVEDETAVCFVIDYRIKGYEEASNSQSDPNYTDRYLSQLEEMVTAHRNHPSVIIWSIGNESIYGSNFAKSFDWIQNNDLTRPVMFSYPGTAPDSISPYQILSMHYPPISGDLNQHGKSTKGFGYPEMPVIFDEWAHVACYNNETITEDPNIRDFWGQSLDMMWSKTYDAPGGLGGAIWGMIDETFMLPKNLDGFRNWWGIEDNTVERYKGTTVGYGEWGIVDIWRRKKPEFWNTKKAYSPIKITTTTIDDYELGTYIKIPIYNRFDHTNLNEITISYMYNDSIKTLSSYNLAPHTKGELILPITDWKTDIKIPITFYDGKKNLIDSYRISQKQEKKKDPVISDKKVVISKSNNMLKFHIGQGAIYLDTTTGKITHMEKNGETSSISGPNLVYKTKGKPISYSTNEINNYKADWKLNNISYGNEKNEAKVTIGGTYKTIKATYDIRIFFDGKIETSYHYENLAKEMVREIGVSYTLEDIFEGISWERDGYWSDYPENHLSALNGKTNLYPKTLKTYREKPEKTWNEDSKSFYYEGTDQENNTSLTHIAKATKENIHRYSLLKNNLEWVTVLGNGELSCRLSKENKHLELYLLDKLDYIDLSWGNFQRNIMLDGSYRKTVSMKFVP
ncbi:glycosyl hydrolase family 2 [Arenibacter algicola]|uniref:beta-galactosidase n=1 Tax=Arenibacter algicola TaxID=616991 RepID=A0ABY3AG62_9FLAO